MGRLQFTVASSLETGAGVSVSLEAAAALAGPIARAALFILLFAPAGLLLSGILMLSAGERVQMPGFGQDRNEASQSALTAHARCLVSLVAQSQDFCIC